MRKERVQITAEVAPEVRQVLAELANDNERSFAGEVRFALTEYVQAKQPNGKQPLAA